MISLTRQIMAPLYDLQADPQNPLVPPGSHKVQGQIQKGEFGNQSFQATSSLD